jgi:hypothetical protein
MQRARRLDPGDIVPLIASPRTFRGAFLNLLLFGLTAAAGEWLVHQIEYLIEYGSRFGAVMSSGPHRLYMGPAGDLLTGVLVLLAVGLTVTFRADERRRRRLYERLPSRIRRGLPAGLTEDFAATTGGTFPALFALQVTLYLVQENVEYAAVGLGWPGLGVLFAAQHITVLPLHCLVALSSAILLRRVARLLRGSRQSLRLAEVLIRIFVAFHDSPRYQASPDTPLPDLRPARGVRGLRAPPLAL